MDNVRIGFISTRFKGTDGVSLETAKWVHVLEGLGHTAFWFAGSLDTPEHRSYLCELAFFDHPRVRILQGKLFGVTTRTRETTNEIMAIKEELKDHLYAFIERYQIELLIPQNVLAIPMHVPLGLALTEVIMETGLPTLSHNHDFFWERDRFRISGVRDYLEMAFPPVLRRNNFEHVVINSPAQHEMARRRGIPSSVVPNVFDFETPAPDVDEYSADFRAEIGIPAGDILILQPTRIVSRKGIEHAIELTRRLEQIRPDGRRAHLVISHDAGDEGYEYLEVLKERAVEAGINMHLIGHRVTEVRGRDLQGAKTYTLWDIYPHADLVTYPSLYEGFGNAFLEAVYFRKPLLVNLYAIYLRDIKPLGFKAVEMSGYITNAAVKQVLEVLKNEELREEWANMNYAICRKYFSYKVLRNKLKLRLFAVLDQEP
jgi:glycosyltransferase involved in cell wall biosynthesis